MTDSVLLGSGESPYSRHPAATVTTPDLLADAAMRALRDSGVQARDVDGFGVCSFTLGPDHAIDLAWRLGLRLRWIMQDTNGGAGALNLLQHAVRAVESGDATTIVLVAGDRMQRRDFEQLVRTYNRATVDHLVPLPIVGPNALFSLLTQRQMTAHGLTRSDYGTLVVRQREWAAANPGAVYRSPLSLEDYLSAPTVADPLCRFDCVPPVSGADAVVVSLKERSHGRRSVVVRAVVAAYNCDQQQGDGLTTGLAACADDLWNSAGCGPLDVGLASVYDDYPAMVVAQLRDLGFAPDGDLRKLILEVVACDRVATNTSGGQLSAGQAGSAGGMHGLVEVVRQLRGQATGREVDSSLAVVTGYGMVLYRYGACANAAVLEAA